MKFLRKRVDKIKPHFEEGGRFYFLHSVFDGFETFLFVPDHVTKKGAHIRDAIDMKRTMIIVVLALMPALLFGIYNTGLQHFIATGQPQEFWPMISYGIIKVIPLIAVTYIVGLGIEFAFAQVRKHEISEGFLVTGILIPLIVPADIPLWMLAIATAFAVIIGKEVFGGSGMNILNPALTARAFLFFAYPSWMSGDKIWVSGMMSGEGIIDGYSGATLLAQSATGASNFINGFGEKVSHLEMFIGTIPGSVGETSIIAILLGALILLVAGLGSWRIMFSTLAGGIVMGLLLNVFAVNSAMEIAWFEQLMLGGFAFGMVFMATDPVTGAQTNKGKYIYGFLIGFLAILIRVLNPAYPEGMMLAILLMNVFAPLIDHLVVQQNIKKRLKRSVSSVKS
ncbi:MAG: NADH:ubiquinone reductase (Na(+)-transporting) subunit B [Bacteroidales bacterium]|nr:NADH:ubiquinone reductase (Na(+)-transporting) subunit B [Bacteroidales bacterium]MDD2385223.1 NADH:ubiquinone reductase (Na(+)-transporting) subunit B [Bacteroidales bacterium]MDD4216713.1 NADH:ubiquinone reductase (Na(+)-transporting) subunit B [Bacteroidales bacterium]